MYIINNKLSDIKGLEEILGIHEYNIHTFFDENIFRQNHSYKEIAEEYSLKKGIPLSDLKEAIKH
tara:strand:- start:323 stop:517 length:195 start_codon:yes stop_codon:yes gene_type:complete